MSDELKPGDSVQFGDGTPTTLLANMKGLKIWGRGDKQYASGLFRLHSEQGMPLVTSLIECRKRNLIPALLDFKMCAIQAGWSSATADRVIREAQQDARIGE